MSMISGYPDGSDITLLNATMFRGRKQEDGKWSNDVMTLVFYDNISNEKKMVEIEDPMNDFYMLKPQYTEDYPQLFAPIDQLEHFECSNKTLVREIAKRTGNYDYYQNNISNGNGRANANIHIMDPRVFFSDMNIEDKYRFYFDQHYTNEVRRVNKCFFDIEADTIYAKNDFPELGECPVNAVTLVMENAKTIYTLLLRDPDNEQANEFEKECASTNMADQLRDFICENVGGYQAFQNFKLDQYNYKLLFYDEEINLITDVFRIINTFKPDFALAWNMAFDMPYLEARIKVLGYDPKTIMCHPDFKRKEVYYFVDERVKNEFAERSDFCQIASYTVFLDQLLLFASRRKGRSQYSSFSLDYIGGLIAKVRKLDYKNITTHISELPRKNYKTFVFYNIFDTIVQHCVEAVNEDVDYTFNKCNQNNTRYSKCNRQTVYLTNRGAKEFLNQGFVIGNNFNRGTEPPSSKFPGAFVGNPRKINDHSKFKVAGHPVYIFDNMDDFDFKALYPSIIRQFGIAPNTQIGRIIIEYAIHDKENRIKDEKWFRSGQFIEDLHSHVWMEFCERWFKLAGYEQLYDDIINYFSNIEMPTHQLRPYTFDGYRRPIEYYGENVKYKNISETTPKSNLIIPIKYYEDYPEERAKEFIYNATLHPNQNFCIKED